MVDADILAQMPIWAKNLTDALGYFGIFIVSFIGSATVILPLPAFIVVFVMGAIMNPWLVAISAASGNAIGELTGYVLGRGGERLIKGKYKEGVEKYKLWFKKDRTFILIVLFAATPLPDDIVGIICGLFNYDLRRFLLASFIGKLLMNLLLAWGGFYGLRWVLGIFGGI
jgi:membrane protein YqaA with SNARE-associated domain